MPSRAAALPGTGTKAPSISSIPLIPEEPGAVSNFSPAKSTQAEPGRGQESCVKAGHGPTRHKPLAKAETSLRSQGSRVQPRSVPHAAAPCAPGSLPRAGSTLCRLAGPGQPREGRHRTSSPLSCHLSGCEDLQLSSSCCRSKTCAPHHPASDTAASAPAHPGLHRALSQGLM